MYRRVCKSFIRLLPRQSRELSHDHSQSQSKSRIIWSRDVTVSRLLSESDLHTTCTNMNYGYREHPWPALGFFVNTIFDQLIPIQGMYFSEAGGRNRRTGSLQVKVHRKVDQNFWWYCTGYNTAGCPTKQVEATQWLQFTQGSHFLVSDCVRCSRHVLSNFQSGLADHHHHPLYNYASVRPVWFVKQFR